MGARMSSSATLQHRRLVSLSFLAGLGLQPVVGTQTISSRWCHPPRRRVVLQDQPLAKFEELVADGVVARGLPRLVLEGARHRRSREESGTGSRGRGFMIGGELGLKKGR